MKNIGIKNNLSKLINMEKAKRIMVTGNNVTLKEVMDDLSSFCNVSLESIKAYKDGKSSPSLPIALRLSEYFNVGVNDIFQIEDYELAIGSRKDRGRKPSTVTTCRYGDCANKVVAKGLCNKHYQQVRNGKIKLEDLEA